jgi:hypothetical protein
MDRQEKEWLLDERTTAVAATEFRCRIPRSRMFVMTTPSFVVHSS